MIMQGCGNGPSVSGRAGSRTCEPWRMHDGAEGWVQGEADWGPVKPRNP